MGSWVPLELNIIADYISKLGTDMHYSITVLPWVSEMLDTAFGRHSIDSFITQKHTSGSGFCGTTSLQVLVLRTWCRMARRFLLSLDLGAAVHQREQLDTSTLQTGWPSFSTPCTLWSSRHCYPTSPGWWPQVLALLPSHHLLTAHQSPAFLI
jgi:hypothetical protein